MVLGTFAQQFVEHGLGHCGIKLLGTETVAAADDDGLAGKLAQAGRTGFGQRGDDVEIKRFAHAAGLLGAVEDGDALDAGGNRRDERFDAERTVEADLEDADFLPLRIEPRGGFLGGLGAGADGDDHAIGLGVPDVIKEMVLAAGEGGEFVHEPLHDLRHVVVVGVAGFARLEVDVGVLRGAANAGVVGGEGARTKGADGLFVGHRAEHFVVQRVELGDFVRGAEAVKEMHERHPGLEGG